MPHPVDLISAQNEIALLKWHNTTLEADRDAWKAKYEAAEERARFQACAITEWKALEAKANRLREIAERKAKTAIEALRLVSEHESVMARLEPDAHDAVMASLVSDHDRANSEMEKQG